MHSFGFLVRLSILSLVLAGQILDIDTSYYIKESSLSAKSTCSLGDVDDLLAIPDHDNVGREAPATPSEMHAARGLWTRKPQCLQKSNESITLCVFTDAGFAQGRGISLITDSTTAEAISKLPAFSNSKGLAGMMFHADPPPFVIRELPGRGRGVIANRTIERGDLIMAYPATTLFHVEALEGPDYHLLHTAVDQLPTYSRAVWLNLATHSEGDEYFERINTNSFGEFFNEKSHYVVVPEVSMFNHDCRPNAMYYFDIQTLTQNLHASRAIYAGEEITITYIDPLLTREERLAITKGFWGFECACSLCTQSTSLTRASDERIKSILELIDCLKVFGSESTSLCKPTPEMAELLVSMYEQERLYASISDAYVLAALAYNAVGNEWTAVKYGRKAIEVGIIHLGPRDLNVTDMEELVRAPREHWSWMARSMVDGL